MALFLLLLDYLTHKKHSLLGRIQIPAINPIIQRIVKINRLIGELPINMSPAGEYAQIPTIAKTRQITHQS
jgi:hypothetical protein